MHTPAPKMRIKKKLTIPEIVAKYRLHYLWSAKMKLVVKRPPSPGDIHGVIRRAPTSSRYRNRRATCVCGRWLEFGPGWIPELQDPVRNAAGRGCNGFSTLRRSFSGGAL